MYARASKLPNLRLYAASRCNIGSQTHGREAVPPRRGKVVPLVTRLNARQFDFFSIGGGIGIVYQPAWKSADPAWWTKAKGRGILTPGAVRQDALSCRCCNHSDSASCSNRAASSRQHRRWPHPRVELHQEDSDRKNFVIVDAAMNDLIRPAFLRAAITRSCR